LFISLAIAGDDLYLRFPIYCLNFSPYQSTSLRFQLLIILKAPFCASKFLKPWLNPYGSANTRGRTQQNAQARSTMMVEHTA